LAAILQKHEVSCNKLDPGVLYECKIMHEKGEHQKALERMITLMEKVAEENGIKV